MMDTYFKLQNGSDVRGIALEGVEGESVNLTPEIARTIGFAFAQWLEKKLGKAELKVAVGNDSRLSAAAIKAAVFQGLEKGGCAVFDSGLSSTPAMFMSTVFENHAYDGSIMLTASHLPFNRNGLKFFIREGGLGKEDIKEILTLATEAGDVDVTEPANVNEIGLMADYANHLVKIIREGAGSETPLDGLKIVVDAGNGAGGYFVDSVLGEHPGSTVVTDSVTSSGLKWWIEEKLAGVHHRFKRGYKNVINEAVRLNESGTPSFLALETSGHGALKENYFLDDGAYQIAKILIKIAQLKAAGEGSVDELIAELPEPAEATEFRMQILEDDFSAYADQVLDAFQSFVGEQAGWSLTPNNFEGIHVTTESGWILMRKSLHDPQIPINIESDVEGDVAKLTETVKGFLSGFSRLK